MPRLQYWITTETTSSYLRDQPLSNQMSARPLQHLDCGGRCERMFVFPQTEADDDDDDDDNSNEWWWSCLTFPYTSHPPSSPQCTETNLIQFEPVLTVFFPVPGCV